jgi:beta-lactam-binding protein with PASTA domain
MTTWLLLLLLYAVPQRTVIVPKVIGLTVPRAEAVLADAGLTLDEVREVPSEWPKGIVMGQGPGPGQRVIINYKVRLYVSKGPEPKR